MTHAERITHTNVEAKLNMIDVCDKGHRQQTKLNVKSLSGEFEDSPKSNIIEIDALIFNVMFVV